MVNHRQQSVVAMLGTAPFFCVSTPAVSVLIQSLCICVPRLPWPHCHHTVPCGTQRTTTRFFDSVFQPGLVNVSRPIMYRPTRPFWWSRREGLCLCRVDARIASHSAWSLKTATLGCKGVERPCAGMRLCCREQGAPSATETNREKDERAQR